MAGYAVCSGLDMKLRRSRREDTLPICEDTTRIQRTYARKILLAMAVALALVGLATALGLGDSGWTMFGIFFISTASSHLYRRR